MNNTKDRLIKKLIIVICIALFAISIASCSLQKSSFDNFLLNTEWHQTGQFAKFCPDNYRAGCWSTAMAQIFYYHRIIPTGTVDYKTTTGYIINEDLNTYMFDWNLFQSKLDDKSSEQSVEQVAKYTYYASIVLEKDFKTGSYITVESKFENGKYTLKVEPVIENIKNHYNCEVVDYHYSKEELETSRESINNLIKEEIDSNRPMMLYIQGGTSGHATVIDGYSEVDNKFLVHINQGSGGWGNKWYDFYQPIIDDQDDMNHRIILTVNPLNSNKKYDSEKVQENKDYLLMTKWNSENNYAKFCPEGDSLGKWTTSLAQILAFHEFKPSGVIEYETSSGEIISEDLGAYNFKFNQFIERLDAMASEKSIEQVAKYNYFTEVVLEKDFGSNNYLTVVEEDTNIDLNKATENIENYYKCNTEFYKYKGNEILTSKEEIIALVKNEIDNKHPILFYYNPKKQEGSSVVIDGYAEENNEFYVHMNLGFDGINQWFKFFNSIEEVNYWSLLTIN